MKTIATTMTTAAVAEVKSTTTIKTQKQIEHFFTWLYCLKILEMYIDIQFFFQKTSAKILLLLL